MSTFYFEYDDYTHEPVTWPVPKKYIENEEALKEYLLKIEKDKTEKELRKAKELAEKERLKEEQERAQYEKLKAKFEGSPLQKLSQGKAKVTQDGEHYRIVEQ